jgi:hypothetical protein
MKIAINKLGAAFVVLLLFFSSCSKKVDYSDYLQQAEKVYPGRADSIIIRSGYQKAEVSSLLSSDPRVVKIRVFWNNRRDSVEAAVTQNDYSKKKTVAIPSIAEGMYIFEVVTLDAMSHRSAPSEQVGQIYGELYVGGLVNRVLKNKSTVNGSPALNWFGETEESPIKGVSVTYPKAGGGTLTVFTSRSEDVTVMVGAAPTGIVSVRTEYLPENAMETFYSPYLAIPY